MQDQPSFTVLDSFMMVICVYLLACFPPGMFVTAQPTGRESSAEEAKDGQDGEPRSDTETKAQQTPVSEV